MEVMVSGLSFISPNTERPLKGEEIAEQGIIRRLFHERTVELNALWYRREDVIVRQTRVQTFGRGGLLERDDEGKKLGTLPNGILHIYP